MKKCLILDLDNTLWGGVLGEDGKKHLKLGMEAPGNGFIAFQQAILNLHDRGIILAINSKNNYEEAIEVISTHPNMILKEKHFAAFRINWNNKVDNVKEIASELNISLDAMVFIDDDPVNRAMIREYLPEVTVPELPKDPSDYAKFLSSLSYFDTQVITNEDKLRGNFYVTERLRKEAEKNYSKKEDFLYSLKTELIVYENESTVVPRLAQLTEKTNQLNTDKFPLTEEDIRRYMNNKKYRIFHARAIDKFGDHGIIAFALIQTGDNEWHTPSFLVSCRVIGRGIEDAFIYAIHRRACKDGIQKLTISFKRSDKNKPAEDFVKKNFQNGMLNTATKSIAPPWIMIRYENV